MIYTQLLHSAAEILVLSVQFKRQRKCIGNGNYTLCTRHESHGPYQSMGCGQSSRWPKRPGQIPSLWPALLRTCRLIHREAAPLLYRSNTFCFEDAATLSSFRWVTDQAQAPLIKNIHVSMPRMPGSRKIYHCSNAWWQYFVGQPFSLAKDFPHLKAITITLGQGLAVASSQDVRVSFELFAKHIYRLDRVQVIGLNDLTVLEYLYPVVERADDGHGRKSVQMDITEYKECIGWKNVIIWWGLPGEEPPCEPTPFTGDRRVRCRLFRIVDGETVSYAAGHSFLDTGE